MLKDFLSFDKRNRWFDHKVKGQPAVKDTIESLGVPHTEVGFIVINNRPSRFFAQLGDGDRIAVYPDLPQRNQYPGGGLKEKPSKNPKFILDSHLGKLARHLRLLGFDVIYKRDFPDEEIIRLVKKANRIVLTRDIGLLKNKLISCGYWVRSIDAAKQIKEVLKRYELIQKIRPFSRCLECNGKIKKVAKKKVLPLLPPKVQRYYDKFYRCDDCRKIYWQGSHYEQLAQLVAKFR